MCVSNVLGHVVIRHERYRLLVAASKPFPRKSSARGLMRCVLLAAPFGSHSRPGISGSLNQTREERANTVFFEAGRGRTVPYPAGVVVMLPAPKEAITSSELIRQTLPRLTRDDFDDDHDRAPS